jgi:hypothetical protein
VVGRPPDRPRVAASCHSTVRSASGPYLGRRCGSGRTLRRGIGGRGVSPRCPHIDASSSADARAARPYPPCDREPRFIGAWRSTTWVKRPPRFQKPGRSKPSFPASGGWANGRWERSAGCFIRALGWRKKRVAIPVLPGTHFSGSSRGPVRSRPSGRRRGRAHFAGRRRRRCARAPPLQIRGITPRGSMTWRDIPTRRSFYSLIVFGSAFLIKLEPPLTERDVPVVGDLAGVHRPDTHRPANGVVRRSRFIHTWGKR